MRRIGVDIGGTFTDVVLAEGDQIVATTKVLTTAPGPAEGVMAGIVELLGEGRELTEIVHATTLATNALIERNGAPIGLIATEGHKDVLQIRREGRYDMYDVGIEFPEPLVSRRLTVGVAERTLGDGSVLTELAREDVEARIAELVGAGVEAVAVCFINSYLNPANERVACDALSDSGLMWSMSAEVAPTMREFDRFSTTVVNEYIRKPVQAYLDDLERRLAAVGLGDVPLFVMISNGGRSTVEDAKRFPVRLIESGPAAGGLHAAAFGRETGRRQLVSFDMGGTTAKICFILDGEPTISPSFEAARLHRNIPGSGIPIRIPCIEMVEIGAGGGSIAWINELELLKVGPQSAGAYPGPACYRNGGELPTVTDADLVLGRLDGSYFLGGAMELDLSAARTAIEEHVAGPLGLTVEAAALGIVDVVDENMANALRMHAIERGIDTTGFSCVAFGGAGGLHAAHVADRLRLREVVIPPEASVLSAQGLLSAPTTFDVVRTHPVVLDDVDWGHIGTLFDELLQSGVQMLERSGVAPDQISLSRYCEMRYVGQGYEVEVRLPSDLTAPDLGDEVARRFAEVYSRLYGRTQQAPLEVLNWRGLIRGPDGQLPTRKPAQRAGTPRERELRFGLEPVPAAVWRRDEVPVGRTVPGPAVIEEAHTTVLVPPGWSAVLGRAGELILSKEPG